MVAYYRGSQLVIFNFTTCQPTTFDKTCVVFPREYSELTHESVINYRNGLLIEGVDKIEAMEERGISKKLKPISKALLTRVQRGAVSSKYTTYRIKNIISSALPR